MSATEVVVPIIVALLGGGFLGGLALILKVRTDSGLVTVQAAESVVIIQTKKIDDLRKEVHEMRGEAAIARAEAMACKTKIERVEGENTELKSQVTNLKTRVVELESKERRTGTASDRRENNGEEQ